MSGHDNKIRRWGSDGGRHVGPPSRGAKSSTSEPHHARGVVTVCCTCSPAEPDDDGDSTLSGLFAAQASESTEFRSPPLHLVRRGKMQPCLRDTGASLYSSIRRHIIARTKPRVPPCHLLPSSDPSAVRASLRQFPLSCPWLDFGAFTTSSEDGRAQSFPALPVEGTQD